MSLGMQGGAGWWMHWPNPAYQQRPMLRRFKPRKSAIVTQLRRHTHWGYRVMILAGKVPEDTGKWYTSSEECQTVACQSSSIWMDLNYGCPLEATPLAIKPQQKCLPAQDASWSWRTSHQMFFLNPQSPCSWFLKGLCPWAHSAQVDPGGPSRWSEVYSWNFFPLRGKFPHEVFGIHQLCNRIVMRFRLLKAGAVSYLPLNPSP